MVDYLLDKGTSSEVGSCFGVGIQCKVEDFKFSLGESGIGEVKYCLEGRVNLPFARSGDQGSMKGRLSEVECCGTVIRQAE